MCRVDLEAILMPSIEKVGQGKAFGSVKEKVWQERIWIIMTSDDFVIVEKFDVVLCAQ